MGLFQQSRFEQKVALVPFSTCHYWTGQINSHGYGVFGRRRAHRISYEMRHGAIPTIAGKPASILHSCDTPLCVNPDHLRAGTQAENMRDVAARGRARMREAHHGAKLNQRVVSEIIADFAANSSMTEIANKFGITVSRVSNILNGKTRWADRVKPVERNDRQLSPEQALEVYRMAHRGVARKVVSEVCGVSVWMVTDIKRGRTYASATGHRR